MIRRATATVRGLTPNVDLEDIIGLVCLAGLWYGLHLFSEALAWTVVSLIGLALSVIVAVGRRRAGAEPAAEMTEDQFAALMGNRR